MRKFIVSIYCNDRGKKIQLIREIRAAMGLGLTEAKNLAERCNYETHDYIVNATQLAGLVVASCGPADGTDDKPLIIIRDAKLQPEIALPTDFSNVTPTLYS